MATSAKTGMRDNIAVSSLKGITRVMNIIGMVILVGMMLLSVSDVFLRKAFNHPIVGGTEVSEFMMVCMALGMAWCMLIGRSITMGMVVDRFPSRVQGIIDTITYLISLGIVAVMSWQSYKDAMLSKKLGDASVILGIPNYPTRLILAFSFLMLAIVIAVLIVRNIAKVVKR
jgi:TRAP-type C4-dicarboxylate transport system permease small subunit